MLLKDLMEEKQLNFNQPLLSVRRFSSTVATETENKGKTSDNSLARLPPLSPYKSELKSGPVRNAGAVPFVWEKTPGKPKDESKLHTHANIEQPLITPNLPPGRVSKIKQQDSDIVSKGTSTVSNSQNGASFGEKVTKGEGSKEGIEEKESSDSDDGDETFLDALDTLSRTESFFMSCRMSGWDDQEEQVQQSGSFSSEQQARDFMIDRFLPAAKAMTYETTPQYASKKPLVGQGQQKQLKKVVSTKKSPTLNQHRPKSLRHCIQDIGRDGSEDENDDSENHTTTACGLFPRLCLLNPMPGLRMEDKAKSTASYIESTKEHAGPPYHGKRSVDSKSEFTEEKEILGILEKFKHICESTDPHQIGCRKLLACESTQTSCESPVEKTLYVDSVHKVKSQTNHTGDDFETLKRDSGIYKNHSIDSSLENSQRLDVINVKAALQAKISESLDSPFLVCSKNSSNGLQLEVTNHSKKMDSEKLGNQGSVLNQDLVMTSSPKVAACKNIDLENQVSSSEKNSSILIQNSVYDTKCIDQECTLASTMVEDDGKIDLESQCVMKLGHQKLSDATSYFEIPLVLPSLKAPSESWLKKTLPTISSRKSNLAANINARSKTPKWETIVKSSNVHRGHLHEELLKPIAED